MVSTPQDSNPGSVHSELMGGRSEHRFRLDRIRADQLNEPLHCRFEVDGITVDSARIRPMPSRAASRSTPFLVRPVIAVKST